MCRLPPRSRPYPTRSRTYLCERVFGVFRGGYPTGKRRKEAEDGAAACRYLTVSDLDYDCPPSAVVRFRIPSPVSRQRTPKHLGLLGPKNRFLPHITSQPRPRTPVPRPEDARPRSSSFVCSLRRRISLRPGARRKTDFLPHAEHTLAPVCPHFPSAYRHTALRCATTLLPTVFRRKPPPNLCPRFRDRRFPGTRNWRHDHKDSCLINIQYIYPLFAPKTDRGTG